MESRRYPQRISEHYRFRLPRKEILPDLQIAEKGVAAIQAGIAFAQTHFTSHAHAPHMAALHHRQMGHLRRLAQGSYATLLFLQSIFGHAMAWTILTGNNVSLGSQKKAPRIHVHSFRKLVASLLTLSPTSRDRLWEHAERLSLPSSSHIWRWPILFSGAIAVARTAYALLRLDLMVYAPTTLEKLALDLDLFCAAPDGKEGLALRIRSSASEAFATYAALKHHPSGNGFARRPDLIHLWDATQVVNHHYGVEWTGVDLTVGLKEEKASEVERALSPHAIIWNEMVPILLPSHPMAYADTALVTLL